MLNHDPARFAKDGYCLYRHVFDSAEVESNQRLMAEAIERDQLDNANYYSEPHESDERWLEICRHPCLLDAVQSVLGPHLILIFSSVFIKPPGSVETVPWHQDNSYWPSIQGTDVVTVWLAIDDTDRENAAMRVIPGSHTGYRESATLPSGSHEMLSRKIIVQPEMEARAASLEMEAGSVSIHDSFLMHSSESNFSNRRRAGYTMRYCSSETVKVDVEKHPNALYLVRGEAGHYENRYIDLRPNGE